MGYLGFKPADKPLTAADITDGIITSAKIVDGTIVNADINASAAIVSTKLSGIGTYSVHAISRYNYQTAVSASTASTNYIDISGGNYVSFTPTSTNDIIFLSHYCSTRQPTAGTGMDTYLMMATSSSIGSGDTKLNYDGQNMFYHDSGDSYQFIAKSFLLPCTSLTPSTTYYIEQAGAQHNGNSVTWNYTSASGSSDYKNHNVSLIHYKYN
jgi:hypothetical protein